MNPHWKALNFDVILDRLKDYALSGRAKEALGGLEPCLQEEACIRRMRETTEARGLLDACGSPPLAPMKGLEEAVTQGVAGAMLLPEQLAGVSQFLTACRRMRAYLQRGEAHGWAVAAYGRSIGDLPELKGELDRCIDGERVCDEASPELKSLRRKKEQTEARIREKLTHILQSRRQYLADSYITNRNGHFVVPVQRRFQNQFGGVVIETSGKGGTVFMEPAAVARLQEELAGLDVEEDGEVRRVLYSLTALVADSAPALRRSMETMEVLDVLFAKAKLSAAMNARAVEIGGARRLDIRQGRHPLLPAERCVPLDLRMEEDAPGVVVTGPNTGGKTVAVKTAGLLSLMAQCGLHIPCGEGSYIAMQDGYWCDIGDSQDISQNLSTFSGHITNVVGILEHASPDSLVLLDELGSGTDPAEGMGIAVAVLEELRRRGCMYLATTHYAQVKHYAERAAGVRGARMAFDRESLQPLYRLELDKSGESCALDIAKRLGLAPRLLERARREVYGGGEADEPDGPAMPAPKSRLRRAAAPAGGADPAEKFRMGDSVSVLPDRESGIVYRPADKNGDVIVQVRGEKRAVRHNRLLLVAPAAELYPPDYDFSIVFDTVGNRKARRIMGKRHDPGVSITCEE